MARVKDTRYVNPQDVYNYLVSEKGLSREHALGMLANIQAESGFNVSIQEKGKAYGSGGVGLFQHTGSRRSELMKYTGGDVSDWKKQVNFALQENLSKAYLKKTFRTPEEASTWFTTQWERPANASSQAKIRLGNINKFSHFTQYESTGNDGVPTGERKFQIMLGDTPTYISLEDFNKELEKVKKAEEKTTESEDRKEVEAAKTKEQSFLEAVNMLYSNSDQNTSPAGAEDQQMGAQGTGYEPIEVPQQQSSLPTMPSLFSTAVPEMVEGGPVKPPKWTLGYNPYAYNAANVVGGYENFGDLTSQNLQLSTPDLFGREKKLNATRFPFSVSAGRTYDKNLTNDFATYGEDQNYDGYGNYEYKTPQELLDSKETPFAGGIPLDAELSLGVEGSGLNPNMKKRSRLGAQLEVGYNPTTGVYGQLNTEQKWALGNNYTNPLNKSGEWRVEPYVSPLNFQVAQKPARGGDTNSSYDEYLQGLVDSGSSYDPFDPNNPLQKEKYGQVEGKIFVSSGAGVDAQVKLPLGMLDAGIGVNYNLQAGQGQKFSPTAHLGYKLPLGEVNLPERDSSRMNLPQISPFKFMSAANRSGTTYDYSLFEKDTAPQGAMEKVNASPVNKQWQPEAEDIFIDFKNNPPGMIEYPPQEDPNNPNNFKFGGQVQKMPDGGSVYTYAERPGSYYQKTNNGKWLISNDGTGGKYVPVQDPTGERSAALNKGATMIMANPTQDKYANIVPSYSKSPMVQSIIGDTQAERKQVENDIAYQDLLSKSREAFAAQQKNGLPQNEQPLEPQDWIWSIPTGLKAAGQLAALQIPYTGISLGTAVNTAGFIHGVPQIPNRVQDWQDFASGEKTWQEATAKTLGTGLEIYGGYDAAKKGLSFAKEIYDAGKGSNIFFNLSDEANAARKLQDIGLLGKQVDPKVFGRYPQLAQTATKATLKKYNTTYRAVHPNAEKMSIDDMVNMAKSGYNIDNPAQVAEYMATTVPIGTTSGYRAGLDLHPSQDALYTGKFQTAEEAAQNLRSYGTYMSEVRPPMNFSEGNPNQWIDQYYTNKLFGMVGDPNSQYVLLRNPEAYQPGSLFKQGAVGFSRDSEYWPYIGNRGEKLLEAVKTYDLRTNSLNSNAQREAINNSFIGNQAANSSSTLKMGAGDMNMGTYEIKNPDYYSQLLNTYNRYQMPPESKKFYTGLISTVKKQKGIVTERQLNELQRLKTGNFNYGKKGS